MHGGKVRGLAMKFRLTTLALLIVCGCIPAFAQPDIEIIVEGQPNQSVMDFGLTFVGSYTSRNLIVNNRTKDSVLIELANASFISITNDSGVPPNDERYKNFVVEGTSPVVIPPSSAAGILFRYLAKDEPDIPADSIVSAQLSIRVASMGPQGVFLIERRFRLIGRRTKEFLEATTSEIRFDSVYISTSARSPQEKPYTVRNKQDRSVRIDAQDLDIKTTVMGEPELTIVPLPNLTIGGKDAATWKVQYQPRNQGLDSAVFTITYRLDTTAGSVSLNTKIAGVGVEQKLQILSARNEQSGTELRRSGDTVDFGTIASAQDTVRAVIVVKNVGNIDPRIDDKRKSLLSGGTESDTASFRVHRSMREGGTYIPRDGHDTIIVTYAPVAAGFSTMRYDITTNVRDRVQGVPNGAETMSLYFTGRQRRAQVAVEPRTLTFDTAVYSPSCEVVVRDSMRITNTGDAELRVRAIRTRSGSLALEVAPQTLSLAPQESAIVRLAYRPSAEGEVQDFIEIESNAPTHPVFEVPFVAVAKRVRDSIVLQVADTLAARPGYENVIVDVEVPPSSLQSLNRCTLAVDVDTTVLRFERTLTVGTATEVAGVPQRLPGYGNRIVLVWSAPNAFLQRSTFTRLVFSARLGDRLDSPIEIASSASSIGTTECPDLVPIRSAYGVFRIDSLCGMTYKTAMLRNQSLAGVFPNPMIDRGRLSVVLPQREYLRAVCVDAFGRELAVVADAEYAAGSHVFDLLVDDLPPGIYSVIVWSGRRYLVVPFVVGR